MNFWNNKSTIPMIDNLLVIKEVPSEMPQFKRIYTKQLDNRCTIKVEMKNFCSRRFSSAELIQPNGSYVIG